MGIGSVGRKGLGLAGVLGLIVLAGTATRAQYAASRLMTLTVDGTESRIVFETEEKIEAPNWSPDGKWLIYNAGDFLYRVPADGSGAPERIEMGSFRGMSNDHVISPDGRTIYFTKAPHIYALAWEGGEPRRITSDATLASWLHSVRPDGKTLAFCGVREGDADIYTISVEGGEVRRLTSGPGYDDGPDYTPGGRWIYYNSDRSGSAQIWRVPAEGGEPEQVTRDERVNWFPHPSPDGKWVVYLSYPPGTTGHPAGKEVILRRMTPEGGEIRDLRRLFGGQGTINSPSWSPSGRRFAFVEYDREEGGEKP